METGIDVLVYIQDRENYGAHNWNGEGDCPQYWKFKIGPTIIIKNTPSIEDAEHYINYHYGLQDSNYWQQWVQHIEEFNGEIEEWREPELIDWKFRTFKDEG